MRAPTRTPSATNAKPSDEENFFCGVGHAENKPLIDAGRHVWPSMQRRRSASRTPAKALASIRALQVEVTSGAKVQIRFR